MLSLLTPMLAFGADGNGMLYGMSSVGVVVILFALYALIRSGTARGQVQATGASSTSYQASNIASSTGNDSMVRATRPNAGEGFSGSDFSGGNDIFDDERDLLMDHEYDGIQELNNKLPPWWVALFYVTVFIGCIYPFVFHEDHDVMFKAEMAAADAQVKAYQEANGGAITEETVELVTDEAALSNGQALYMKNCVACHLADGGGIVGPNLTDKYWLHGGGIHNVFKTIKEGVPDKGMVSWKASLTPTEIQQVASYILVKLQGTTPANPKAPQGEEYKE